MKPNKFLSQRLIDKLVQPLLETFKLMFLSMCYTLTERQTLDLMKNADFNQKFEICIRDCLKDYNNSNISYAELLNDIKFNIGEVYNYLDEYTERMCHE